MKIGFFNKTLLKTYAAILSALSVITSFLFIFVEIPEKCKNLIGVLFFVILLVIYCIMLIIANRTRHANLSINNSTLTVKVGDIFLENGLKVIAFNEYFDTCVDDKLISASSLNGQYINSYVPDIPELDRLIAEDAHLLKQIISIEPERVRGKKNKYQLGTIFGYNEYLLTAFSRFDQNNRAYLKIEDYINCLLNFWNELDIVYAGRPIVIPLLGTGITRFSGYEEMCEQEKLELLIWSFKISKVKFTYPSKITILIHSSIQEKINFYKLREV